MGKATLLLRDQDIDALIDRELPDDRYIALVNELVDRPALADHAVDQACLSDVLRQVKDELYAADPELRRVVKTLMDRRNTKA